MLKYETTFHGIGAVDSALDFFCRFLDNKREIFRKEDAEKLEKVKISEKAGVPLDYIIN